MTPLSLRLIGAALVVAIVAALSTWLAHSIATEATAKEQARQAATAAAWAASTQRAQALQDALQQENLDEANRFNARRDADAHDARAAAVRLRQYLGSGRDLGTRSTAPAASGAPSGVPAPGMVPADVFLRAVDMAASAAAYADCLRGVSELCAKDYGALSR